MAIRAYSKYWQPFQLPSAPKIILQYVIILSNEIRRRNTPLREGQRKTTTRVVKT